MRQNLLTGDALKKAVLAKVAENATPQSPSSRLFTAILALRQLGGLSLVDAKTWVEREIK